MIWSFTTGLIWRNARSLRGLHHAFRLLLLSLLTLATVTATATAQTQSLTTIFDSNKIDRNGNMFDIDVLGNDIILEAFDLHLGTTGQIEVEFFYRTGSFVGHTDSSVGWTLHHTGMVQGAGDGNPSRFTIPDLNLDRNQSYAFYIRSDDRQMRQTEVDAVGVIFAANADLQIREGVAVRNRFGNTRTPRLWNGTIFYSVLASVEADAGSDQFVSAFETVQLDGTDSSPAADITSYLWEQIAGPDVTLSDDGSATPSFTAPQPSGSEATLTFRLTVTGSGGLTDTDTVTITVQGVPVVSVDKAVSVWSETGSNCADTGASPPAIPAQPTAIPGACIEYVITVSNSGPVPATNVTLTDAIPPQLTLRTVTLGDEWDAGATLDFTPDCSGQACVVEITDGTIPAQSSREVTLRASIN